MRLDKYLKISRKLSYDNKVIKINKNKIKNRFQVSASKPSSALRDIGWVSRLAGTYLGFMMILLAFATIYNIYSEELKKEGI